MHSSSLDASLVRILIDDQEPRKPVGAGFLVTPDHILTCAHVVNDALMRLQNTPDRPDMEVFLDFPLIDGHPVLKSKILKRFPKKKVSKSQRATGAFAKSK